MERKERLNHVFDGREPDRLPVLGGWITSPAQICGIAGGTEDEYWQDPKAMSLEAYDMLGTDGLIGVFVPKARDGYRCVDSESFVDYSGEQKSLEIRRDAFAHTRRVLLVDEWVETGAQIDAAIALIEHQGAAVAGVLAINMDENERVRALRQRYTLRAAAEVD